MTRKEFEKWVIGKSKKEIMAILPTDTKVNEFRTSKNKISMLSVLGGQWKLYTSLHFDKATQRVVAC